MAALPKELLFWQQLRIISGMRQVWPFLQKLLVEIRLLVESGLLSLQPVVPTAYDHKTTGWLFSKRPVKTTLFWLPYHGQASTNSSCSEPHPAWSEILDVASTPFLGNLCQWLTTLTIKNVFLISNLNMPSFSLGLLPLVTTHKKTFSLFPTSSL